MSGDIHVVRRHEEIEQERTGDKGKEIPTYLAGELYIDTHYQSKNILLLHISLPDVLPRNCVALLQAGKPNAAQELLNPS